MLHLGGVGKYVSQIWGWSVHSQESGDLQFASYVFTKSACSLDPSTLCKHPAPEFQGVSMPW